MNGAWSAGDDGEVPPSDICILGILYIRIISDMNLNADPGSPGDHALGEYLARLRRAAWYLPRDRREQVLSEIADRIADALEPAQPAPAAPVSPATQPPSESTQPLSSSTDVAGVLAKLGEPKTLIQAVDGHVPGTEAGWLEYIAVILVLLAGLLFSLGWTIGVILLWTSARWRWPDKLLATLVWPGGLLVARLLTIHYHIGTPSFPGAGGSVRFILDSTLGHHPLRHILVLAAAIAPPVFVAIRLLRRARRPQRPAATWPTDS
jgi:hypothetical protein